MAEPNKDRQFVLEDILKEFHSDENFSEVSQKPVPEPTEAEAPDGVVLPRVQSDPEEEKTVPDDDTFDSEMEQSLRVIFGGDKKPKEEKQKRFFKKEKRAAKTERETPTPFSADLFNEIYEQNRTEPITEDKKSTTTIRIGKHMGEDTERSGVRQGESTHRIGKGLPVAQHADPEKLLQTMTVSMRSVRKRIPIVFLLAIPLLYLTLTVPFNLPSIPMISYINHPANFVFAEMILMIVIGIVGLDILTNGIYSLFCLRPGGDTLIAISFLSSLLHCAGIIFFPEWGGYMPICLIPALSIGFSLMGDSYNLSARIQSLRNVMHMDAAQCATLLCDVPEKGRRNYIRTRMNDRTAFYDNINHSDPISRTMVWYAPAAIIVPLVCAAICAIRTGRFGLFFWAWSMIASIVPSFGLYLCCALPYARMTQKCMKSGAAVGNCDAVEQFAASGNCVVCDGDLFPVGSVKLNGYKMLSAYDKNSVLAMTAAAIQASGSHLSRLFQKALDDECIPSLQAEGIEFSGHGGIQADVNGHKVLVGTANFINKLELTIPDGVRTRNAIFSVIDMQLCAAFSLRYEYLPRITQALEILLHSGRTPLIASRDFNLRADDLEEQFELTADSLQRLPTEQQVALNNPDRTCDGEAVVFTRDGLSGPAAFLESARRYSRARRACTLISVLASAIGGAIMGIIAANAWVSVVAPWHILFFMSAVSLPGWLISAWIRKF